MYKGEPLIGICATAAVMDPLELCCYSSLPLPEIWGLEDQQSLFWLNKGIDGSEVGALCSSRNRDHVRVATWPGKLCVVQDTEAALRTSPSLCVGVLLSLVLSLQGAAMKIGVWD